MTQKAIRAALEQALAAMTPALATAWENKVFSPPAASVPYQRVFVMFAEPDNIEQGRGHQEIGIFQVSLNYPLQKGDADARARAEAIRAAFPRGSSFTSGGYTVIIARTPEIGQGVPDGGMWVVPVKIRFYANVF